MNATRTVERLRVTGGDRQTVSHAGTHLLGELADRVGLTSGYSAAIPWSGERAFGHDRGRLLGQVAVMLAGGGRCVADMAALRDQPDVFGEVASAATIWRAFDSIDDTMLAGLRTARRQGSSESVGRRRRTRRSRLRCRRVAGGDPLRTQAGSDAALQTRVRVPPDVLFPRRHRRSARWCAAPWERGRELRRRPVGGGRDGDRPTARRTPTRSSTRRRRQQRGASDPGACRFRRRRPRVHRRADRSQLPVLDLRPSLQRARRRHRPGRR